MPEAKKRKSFSFVFSRLKKDGRKRQKRPSGKVAHSSQFRFLILLVILFGHPLTGFGVVFVLEV
jgi:hypothetical protein